MDDTVREMRKKRLESISNVERGSAVPVWRRAEGLGPCMFLCGTHACVLHTDWD